MKGKEMNKFIITTKDGRKFTTSRYKDMDHLFNNAWVHEGGLFCDNETYVAIDHIQMIEPAMPETDETK